MSTDVRYHMQRARTERDIAYRSADGVAGDIHMRLSALHLGQALLLQAVRRGPDGNVLPFETTKSGAQAATLPPRLVEVSSIR